MNEALNFKFKILGYSEEDRSVTVLFYTDAIYEGNKALLERQVERLAQGWPHMSIEETYRLAEEHAPFGISVNLWLPESPPAGDELVKFIEAHAPIESLQRRHAHFTQPAPDLRHVEALMGIEHQGAFTPTAKARRSNLGAIELRQARHKQIKATVL